MRNIIPPDKVPKYREYISKNLRKSTPAEIPSLEKFNTVVATSGTTPGSREKKETKKYVGQPSGPSRSHGKSASGKRGRTTAVAEPSASVGEAPQHPRTTGTSDSRDQAEPGHSGPHLLQQQATGQAVLGDATSAAGGDAWLPVCAGNDHIFWNQAQLFGDILECFDMTDPSPDSCLPTQSQQLHTMAPPAVAETLELWRFKGPTQALKLPAMRSPLLEYTMVPAHMLTDMGFELMSTDLERQFVPLPPGDNNIPCSGTASPATYFVHKLLVFPVEGRLPIEIDALVYPFQQQFDTYWHHPFIHMGSQLIRLLEEYPRLSISGDAVL